MIPAQFDYYRPNDMPAVISLLEQHGETARVLAGGHSLIPLMKVRMTAVSHLIDLKDVADMNSTTPGDGGSTLEHYSGQVDRWGNLQTTPPKKNLT